MSAEPPRAPGATPPAERCPKCQHAPHAEHCVAGDVESECGCSWFAPVPAPVASPSEGTTPAPAETAGDQVRRLAREAVDHASAQQYDGSGIVWRCGFVAEVLKGLMPLLPEGYARTQVNTARVRLLDHADEELEEQWPK